MATNIPPHNLGELCDAVVALVQNPELSDEALFRIIPAPDFPTGGQIMGLAGAEELYKTGMYVCTFLYLHSFFVLWWLYFYFDLFKLHFVKFFVFICFVFICFVLICFVLRCVVLIFFLWWYIFIWLYDTDLSNNLVQFVILLLLLSL